MWNYLQRHFIRVILFSCILIVLLMYNLQTTTFTPMEFRNELVNNHELVLNTTVCKIPKLDPFNDNVKPFVKKVDYYDCTTSPLLTYIEGDQLVINQTAFNYYYSSKILPTKCCYSHILRHNGDENVRTTSCQYFQHSTTLTYPYIKVVCYNILGVIYRNVHHAILSTTHRPQPISTTPTQWSVLLIGIDSMSALNLQRTMPKVYNHLETNFIGLKGYNKIADNTFPNVMAVISGRNDANLGPICYRNETFDKCDFLWRDYKRAGFITAFGEDEPFLNTFNYYKKGFDQPPTDIYLRPYLMGAYYFLNSVHSHTLSVCTGLENTGQRMLNAAKQFQTTFNDRAHFGLFWMNSFSHDDVNSASAMHEKVFEFLSTIELNQTVLVFFSDHGFRFGNIRFTYSGWLEERLPYMYFKFPPTFHDQYPQLIETLKVNAKERLTTPFDVFMTLQDILKLSNPEYSIRPAVACPKCTSLFQQLPIDRTCNDANIPEHFCTCNGYSSVSLNNPIALQLTDFIIEQIHEEIRKRDPNGLKCSKYQLQSMESVGMRDNQYLILFRTFPYAIFEATVGFNDNDQPVLLGQISRANWYGPNTGCVEGVLKQYCYCDDIINKITRNFCYWFKCSY